LAQSTLNLKRGDTLFFYAELADASGDPIVLTIPNIKSQVRQRNGVLVDTLTVETTATAGRYLLKSTDTADYPLETLDLDIKINDDSVILSTETILLSVSREVTEWV
jgi:hypothetical protein